MSSAQRRGRPRAGARRAALWAAIAALGLGGVALAGCGSDDDGETTVAPATTEAEESTGATGPSGSKTKEKDTDGSSGGTAPGDAYDPEQDTEENDIPPPPGSPQERFEQDCDANPGKCD